MHLVVEAYYCQPAIQVCPDAPEQCHNDCGRIVEVSGKLMIQNMQSGQRCPRGADCPFVCGGIDIRLVPKPADADHDPLFTFMYDPASIPASIVPKARAGEEEKTVNSDYL